MTRPIAQLRECTTIADRLRICPDERLQAYVNETNIVSCKDVDTDDGEDPDDDDSLEDDLITGKGDDDDCDDDANNAAAHVNVDLQVRDDDANVAAAHLEDIVHDDANVAAARHAYGNGNDNDNEEDPFLDVQSTQDLDEFHSYPEDINIRKRSREDMTIVELQPSSQEVLQWRQKRQRLSEYVPVSERKCPPEQLLVLTSTSAQQSSDINNSPTQESPLIPTSLLPSLHFAHQISQAPTYPGDAVNLPVDRF